MASEFYLPHPGKIHFRFMFLVDAYDQERVSPLGYEWMLTSDLLQFNRNHKLLKKRFKKYHFLLCSASVIRKVPCLVGPSFNKMGNFPFPINAEESIEYQLDRAKRRGKWLLKERNFTLAHVVGNCSLNEQQVYENVREAILGLLKINWPLGIKTIDSLVLKSTQGQPIEIFKYSEAFPVTTKPVVDLSKKNREFEPEPVDPNSRGKKKIVRLR